MTVNQHIDMVLTWQTSCNGGYFASVCCPQILQTRKNAYRLSKPNWTPF